MPNCRGERHAARDAGSCPVREDLYAQCFDELIRRLTLDGPERGCCSGALDEVRMTVDAYKVLRATRRSFGGASSSRPNKAWRSSKGRRDWWSNKDLENRLGIPNGVEKWQAGVGAQGHGRQEADGSTSSSTACTSPVPDATGRRRWQRRLVFLVPARRRRRDDDGLALPSRRPLRGRAPRSGFPGRRVRRDEPAVFCAEPRFFCVNRTA